MAGQILSVKYIFSIFTFTLLLNGCDWVKTSTSVDIDDNAVATVAGRTISVEDFTKTMVRRSGGVAERVSSNEQKQSLLQEMIQREVQIVAAKKAGYETDPEIVKTLENMMVTKLRSEQLEKIIAKVTVTEDEINSYYQSNLAKYTTPAMLRIAIIKFSVYATASEQKQAEVKKAAEEVLNLAKTLPDSVRGFGSLAAKYSADQASRYVGGDLGWVIPDKVSSYLNKAILQSLSVPGKNNEEASMVKGGDGYYLVKLIDKKPQHQQPVEKVSRSIRYKLQSQKRKQVEANWLQSLEKEVTPVVINQAVLESVKPPRSMKADRQKNTPPPLPKG